MAGRPREFDISVALRKARDLFWDRGFEGVSINDLSAALGLASARIYAAFGSKEALFRDAISLYEAEEGGFADRALSSKANVIVAIRQMFEDGIALYTRKGHPRGCMVVSSATNCTVDNEEVGRWLAQHRRVRTARIARRLRKAVENGELATEVDPNALGELFAAALHGISVQARDGATGKQLLAIVPPLLGLLK